MSALLYSCLAGCPLKALKVHEFQPPPRSRCVLHRFAGARCARGGEGGRRANPRSLPRPGTEQASPRLRQEWAPVLPPPARRTHPRPRRTWRRLGRGDSSEQDKQRKQRRATGSPDSRAGSAHALGALRLRQFPGRSSAGYVTSLRYFRVGTTAEQETEPLSSAHQRETGRGKLWYARMRCAHFPRRLARTTLYEGEGGCKFGPSHPESCRQSSLGWGAPRGCTVGAPLAPPAAPLGTSVGGGSAVTPCELLPACASPCISGCRPVRSASASRETLGIPI